MEKLICPNCGKDWKFPLQTKCEFCQKEYHKIELLKIAIFNKKSEENYRKRIRKYAPSIW